MASPAKKRKLNNDSKSNLPSRGLEYFFAKQQKNRNGEMTDGASKGTADAPPGKDHEMTDEQLARKLQDEWNQEQATLSPGLRREGEPPAGSSQDPEVAGNKNAIANVHLPSKTPDQGVAGTSNKAQLRKGTLALQSVAASVDTVSESIPLDENPLTFEPGRYIPQLKEHWAKEGGNASYALLARCFVLVSGTSSRIKIVDTLVNCLRILIEADPESLLPAVWLSTNAISPPYISLELGLGGSAISKALRQVCGLDSRALKSIYDKYGDAGDVAFEAKKKQSFTLRAPKPLTIKGVYSSLVKIASAQGQGSAEVKQRIVDRLLQDARGGEESRYIVRTLCQHLRIGAVKTTLLIALSRAFLLSRPPVSPANARPDPDDYPLRSPDELRRLKKEDLAEVWARAEEIVKACFARRPDYNDLIPAMLKIGVCPELLVHCELTLHIPLRPMLGSITRDLSEMLTKLQGRDFACEFKYDGQRAQVHCDEGGRVSIFSRHLELMTDKYPDLVALVPQIRGHEGLASSFIIEGEVVAVDQATGELKNFQTLTNRARKDVAIGSITIAVCLFAFDIMYLNGQPLLDRPFRERRSLLRSLFVEIPNRFTWVRSMDATSQDSEAVLDFFKQATDSKCEGIMVKILDNNLSLPPPNNNTTTSTTTLTEAADIATPVDQQRDSADNTGKGKTKEKEKEKASSTAKNTRRKPLLATYEPDKRLESWLKVKKDYSSSFDTLDLVPVAAWHGQGRKAKWWSPILLAVRNEESGALEAVCKCMSGFTDAFYKANRKFYDDGSGSGSGEQEEPTQEAPAEAAAADTEAGSAEKKGKGQKVGEGDGEDGNESESEDDNDEDENDEDKSPKYKNIRKTKPSFVEYAGGYPDVWFEPQEVWEVAFADITLSPTYTAALGLVSQDRGLSLRFPRFLRKREDKGVEEASTNEFLAGLFRKQEAKAPLPLPAQSAIDNGEEEGGEIAKVEEDEDDA